MSSIQESIANASCILCRQKGYGCKCGGAAGEMTPEAAHVFWDQLPQRSAIRRAQDKKEIEERGWKPTVHVEQERKDRKAKEEKRFLFAGGMFIEPEKFELDFVNGFMGSKAKRAPSTPFEPRMSFFPPVGLSMIEEK